MIRYMLSANLLYVTYISSVVRAEFEASWLMGAALGTANKMWSWKRG